MEYFDGAQVNVAKSLKGSLSEIVTVFYSAMNTPSEKETNPAINKDYIFFVDILSPTQLSVVKLLPATNDRVTEVQALIAAAPVGK